MVQTFPNDRFFKTGIGGLDGVSFVNFLKKSNFAVYFCNSYAQRLT